MIDEITDAFLCGIYVESGPGKGDVLSARAEEVFADFLRRECNLRVHRYEKGGHGLARVFHSQEEFPIDKAYTRSEILYSLLSWLEEIACNEGKNCLLYFCGHGAIDASGFSLITRDAEPKFSSETGFSLAFLYHLLRRYDEKNVRFLVIIDACMTGKNRRFMIERFPKNTSILFTTKRGEVAVGGYGSVFINNFISSARASAKPLEKDGKKLAILSDIIWSLEKRYSEFGFDQFLAHPDEVALPCAGYSISRTLSSLRYTFSEGVREKKVAQLHYSALCELLQNLRFRYDSYIEQLKPQLASYSDGRSVISLKFRSRSPLAHLALITDLTEKFPIFSAVNIEMRRSTERKMREIRMGVERGFDAQFFLDEQTGSSEMILQHNEVMYQIIQVENFLDFVAKGKYQGMSLPASLLRSGHFLEFVRRYLAILEPERD